MDLTYALLITQQEYHQGHFSSNTKVCDKEVDLSDVINAVMMTNIVISFIFLCL